jgi:pyruvate dehydrogenase E2 component (dihydrolipoamide acetyltransferase)
MADIQIINLPDFGEFDDVEVIEVCVKEGQLVDKEEPIIVLETDKAAMEIPASVNGFIHKVLLKEGDKVKIGMPFLEIKIDPSTAKDDIKSNDLKDKKEELVPDENNIDQEISYKEKKNFNKKKNTSIHSGPATRKLAREFGIDLNQITGSGPSNRILKEDLHNYVKNILNNTSANNTVSSKPNIDFSIWGSIKEEKLTKFKKTALDNLHSSWVNIPHVTQHDEADISDLLELRLKLNKKHKVKISPLAYIVKSTAESLKHFPEMNSSLSNDKELIIYKDYFNIGIAIDTDDGLIVPNIKNANEKSISEISTEISKLSELAKKRRITKDMMSGATFTISSLGGFGGKFFTPIINPPEVGILGLSKIHDIVKLNRSTPYLKKYLPMSLSYDHRVINGVYAVNFLNHLISGFSDIKFLEKSFN